MNAGAPIFFKETGLVALNPGLLGILEYGLLGTH